MFVILCPPKNFNKSSLKKQQKKYKKWVYEMPFKLFFKLSKVIGSDRMSGVK